MIADTPGKPEGPRVKCPGCGALCLFAPANKWRPFCSERCRSLDLGAWASERYRVNGQAHATLDADTPDPS